MLSRVDLESALTALEFGSTTRFHDRVVRAASVRLDAFRCSRVLAPAPGPAPPVAVPTAGVQVVDAGVVAPVLAGTGPDVAQLGVVVHTGQLATPQRDAGFRARVTTPPPVPVPRSPATLMRAVRRIAPPPVLSAPLPAVPSTPSPRLPEPADQLPPQPTGAASGSGPAAPSLAPGTVSGAAGPTAPVSPAAVGGRHSRPKKKSGASSVAAGPVAPRTPLQSSRSLTNRPSSAGSVRSEFSSFMHREHESFYIFPTLSALERHRSPDRSSLIARVSHLRDRFHQALGGVTITCPLDIRRENPGDEHSRLIYEAPSGAFGGVGDYFCLASLPLRGRMLESWCFLHISVGSSIRRSRIRVIDPVDDVRGQTREVINDWLALSENPLSQIPDDAPDGEVSLRCR